MKYEVEIDEKHLNKAAICFFNRIGATIIKEVPVKPIEDESKPQSGRVKYGNAYWLINSFGSLCQTIEAHHKIDDDRYKVGNYFAAKEEAEFAAERLKVINELEKFAVKKVVHAGDEPYYGIVYDADNKSVRIVYKCLDIDSILFLSKADVEAAIDVIGEERLIKYYFRIEED